MLLCRCDRSVPPLILDKCAKLTGVPRQSVFEAPDVSTIYEVPIEFWQRHIDDLIADKFHLRRTGCRIHPYRELVEKYTNGHDLPKVTIGIVGKYENCDEAYLSLREACIHAGVQAEVKVNIKWIKAEDLEQAEDLRSIWRHFTDVDGVIVPGGFDCRGVEGKQNATRYCREKKIPFLGICLGMQVAVIEFSQNVLGLEGANSEEFDKNTPHPVIHYVNGQHDGMNKSGTMRLGAYDCVLAKDSLVRQLYGKKRVSERHRHRYEVNNIYKERFEQAGLLVVGENPDSNLIEMIELKQDLHPYFVATQAHPEFKSRLGEPAPLFYGLVKAAAGREKKDVETK